jgi:hypothetical protein
VRWLDFWQNRQPKREDAMEIACLGWGSLIWDPRELPVRGKWFEDGPMLPIEFARQSRDGRMTLVIAKVAYSVRTLWTLMSVRDLDEAKLALADREGIEKDNVARSIGFWDSATSKSHGQAAAAIEIWARNTNLDGAVWTDLQSGFLDKRGPLPAYNEVLDHLKALPYERKKVAEEYIRKAPAQIDTEYRRGFGADLGWFPIST